MSETKIYKITPAKREEIDGLIRAAVKKAATENGWSPTPAVEAALDKRYSERIAEKEGDVAWAPYERYLLSNGHTVYVGIKSMSVSVSDKPSKLAIQRAKAKTQRAADRAERKAKRDAAVQAREAKKAEAVKAAEVKKNESAKPVVKVVKSPAVKGKTEASKAVATV